MLRAPSRSPLAQLIARVLVVALVAAAIPLDATASLPVGEVSKLTKSAFGELLAHTGSDPQPYAFTGEPYDPNLGFQYHRARWMDARVGRFTAEDTFPGIHLRPSSLHRYLYSDANPANAVDPTGALSSLIWGREVHAEVGSDFRATKPGRRLSDVTLNEVLFQLYQQHHMVDYVGNLRPDLVDLDTKEVFEIKPALRFAEGVFQLEGYVQILNWADPDKTRPWTTGASSSYRPPSTVPVRFGFTAKVLSPIDGVILYDVIDAQFTLLGAVVGIALIALRNNYGAQVTHRAALATLTQAMAPGLP